MGNPAVINHATVWTNKVIHLDTLTQNSHHFFINFDFMDKYVISQNALSVLNFFELQFNNIPLSFIQIPILDSEVCKNLQQHRNVAFPCTYHSFMGHHGKSLHATEIESFSRCSWRREQSCAAWDYSEACNMKCQQRPLMFIPPDGCCDTRCVFHLSAVVIRVKLSRTCDLSSFLIMINISHFFKLTRCLNKTCHLTSVELIFQQIINMSVSRVIIRATAPLRCEIKY